MCAHVGHLLLLTTPECTTEEAKKHTQRGNKKGNLFINVKAV